jgi:arylsulfatase A-like enzyme
MTGQYSIRNGLSLIIVPGSPSTLSQARFTMGELFKGSGYATAIFGKWHLGSNRRACRQRTASTSSTAFRPTSPGTRPPTSTRSS